VRRPHLRQHPIQPLQRPVEVELDPAGRGGDDLPPVLGAPALDEADPDGAHAGEAVDRLEALVDGLSQHGGELEVVEDLEVALCGAGTAPGAGQVWGSAERDNSSEQTGWTGTPFR